MILFLQTSSKYLIKILWLRRCFGRKRAFVAEMLRRQNSIPEKALIVPAPLQPPEGYYVVDDELYRATSVQPVSFSFLDKLKLK